MSNLHFRTIIRKDGTAMASAVLLTEENLAAVVLSANRRHFGLVRIEMGELVIRRKYEDDLAVPGMWVAETDQTFVVVEDIEDWIDYERPGLPLTPEFESHRVATMAAFEKSKSRPTPQIDVVSGTLTEEGMTTFGLYGGHRLNFAVQVTEENPKGISIWLLGLALKRSFSSGYVMNDAGICVLRLAGGRDRESIDFLPGDWLLHLEDDRIVKVEDTERLNALLAVEGISHCTPMYPQTSSSWDM